MSDICTELMGSRSFGFSRIGGTGQRKFLVRTNELYNVCTTWTSGFPDQPLLYCVDWRATPAGSCSSSGSPYLAIEANYGTLADTDDAPTLTYAGQVDILEIGGSRTWASTSGSVEVPLSIPIHKFSETLEYTVGVGDFDIAVVTALLGTVNASTFRGFSAGQVLFSDCGAREVYDFDSGEWKIRVSYTFLYWFQDHNYIWNGEIGEWDMTNPVIYSYGDFSALGIPT